jgi:hypothetical protein
METDAAMLLKAWECGAIAAPLDRAPSLLHSLGAVPQGMLTGELTVGQCDARLFELRRALFGEVAEVVATCPTCQTEVDLKLMLGQLQPRVREGHVPPLTLHADGYTLRCRTPRNDDLRSLANCGGDVTLHDLLERCVLEARSPDGAAVAPHHLPDTTVKSIAEALSESDPGARTVLRVHCPCGSEWTDELDIRMVLWTDLTEWVGRTLTEVHQLARAYGWSEAEILAMNGWRRRWYLEALGL